MAETCLGGRSELYVPDPLPTDLLTSFCIENRSVRLKYVIPEVVKYFRLPRPVNYVLGSLGTRVLECASM
jgi:hypothetical protein